MNRIKAVGQLARVGVRSITTAPVRNQKQVHEGYKKLKTKQEFYQVDNGVPIHLKGGFMDKFLFQTTALLSAIGLVLCIQFYIQTAYPKK